MRRIFVKLNGIKRKLLALKDRKKTELEDISKGDKRKIWLKLYAGRIAASFLALLVGVVNVLTAAASITLSGGNWDMGLVQSGATNATAGSKWTVTGSADGTEDIDIKVSNASSWTPDSAGTAGGTNKFALRVTDSGGTIITGTDARLRTTLAMNGSFNFGLWFKAPPVGSEPGAHTLTVTLTAKNWAYWCGSGYGYANRCWYSTGHWGHHGWNWTSCDWMCAHYAGKSCTHGNLDHRHDTTTNYAVVNHYWAGHQNYGHYNTYCHAAASRCSSHNWVVTYSDSGGGHEHCSWHDHACSGSWWWHWHHGHHTMAGSTIRVCSCSQ